MIERSATHAPARRRLLEPLLLLTLVTCAHAGERAQPPVASCQTIHESTPQGVQSTLRYAAEARQDSAVVSRDPLRKQRFEQLVPKLDAYFGRALEINHVPGLAIGIVLDGETVYLKGFGVQSLETNTPFSVDSVFRIASVTKSITAMAILKLRDEGKLQLDAAAARYVPALEKLAYPTLDSSPVSVRELLTHGSGLPEDNYWVDASDAVSDEQLTSLLESGLRMSRAPNSGYEYSNTDYAVLGKVIEHVSGMPAREYIRREILAPLDMRSSVWSPEETKPENIVVGYRGMDGYHGNDSSSSHAAPLRPLGVYETAGGLYASMRDMTKYVAFHLNAWPARNDPEQGPLRRSSVREMHQGARQADPASFPRTMLPSRRPAAVRGADAQPRLLVLNYGFGFFATTTCDDVFYAHHDGQLPGYTTSLSLYPARGYGLVMFVNDERMESYPPDEVTAMLRDAGVIDALEPAPVPALDAARSEVEQLLESWDEARARALFDPVFWNYQAPQKLQEQLAQLVTAHGRCRTDSPVKVQNLTRGSWHMACDTGEISFVVVLAPAAQARLQTLLWEDSLPPSFALEQAAQAVTGWIRRWDDIQVKNLLAPDANVASIRKLLRLTSAKHGECRVERALTSDGATHAKFLLDCTDSAAELSLTLTPDAKRVAAISCSAVRTQANCAP